MNSPDSSGGDTAAPVVTSHDYWVRWHAQYDDPQSPRSHRLAAVQRQLRAVLDQSAAGPIRLISMCAGKGRDVLGALEDHPRRRDVLACLVELNPDLAREARESGLQLGLDNVQVVEGDASWTSAYATHVPANIILTCGVFGSTSREDMAKTVLELPRLGAEGAVTIWTMEGNPPDKRPWFREVLREAGFEELAYETARGAVYGVGTSRWPGAPLLFRPDHQMFVFRPRA